MSRNIKKHNKRNVKIIFLGIFFLWFSKACIVDGGITCVPLKAYGTFYWELVHYPDFFNAVSEAHIPLQKWFPLGYEYEKVEQLMKRLDFSQWQDVNQPPELGKIRQEIWWKRAGPCLCAIGVTSYRLDFMVQDGLIIGGWADTRHSAF